MATPTFDAPLDRCPLCRSPRIGPHDRDLDGVSIDRCRDCGLMFINPQYTADVLATKYADYGDVGEREGNLGAERRAQKEADLARLEPYCRGGRLLAVGCGWGVELEVMRDRGFAVEGYDVDRRATAALSARLGLPVHSGPFATLDLPAGAYQCIIADHVLEHPRDPALYLRRFRNLLAPDGVLYLGVPNLAALTARLQTAWGRAGLKRRTRGRHYDAHHHLFFYTPATLRRLLAREFGYQVLEVVGAPRVTTSRLRYRLARRFPALCSRLAVVARVAR